MYKAVDLSKYIVTKCVNDGHPISNLQLQKILYYIQKAFLKRDSYAFPDEIEAWQFGPVVPDSYYRFCSFGSMPISISYDDISIVNDYQEIINPIIENKRSLKPWDMVDATHKAGGAWDKIYKKGLGNHKTIPTELIKAEE